MARNQTSRILEAMVRTVGDSGYADTSVADVLRRAGVSRKTFYALFEDKEDCFVRAYDAVMRVVMTAVLAARDPEAPWPDQVHSVLSAFLELFPAEPALARVLMVEVHAAGPRALERYQRAMYGFVPYLELGRRDSRYRELLPESMSHAVIGGVAQALYLRVAAGEADRVPEMLPDLLYFVLCPYLGRAKATRAVARALRQERPATDVGATIGTTP